jgi:hypothetical protein
MHQFSPPSAASILSTLEASPGRARLKFRCLVVAGAETQPFERIALMLQKQFFDVGVDMELELVQARDYIARVATGRFEAALFEFNARTPSWLHGFWRSPSERSDVWIKHGYSAADRELDAMHLAETEEDLQRALASVFHRMQDDPPAIFIAWPEVSRAASNRFAIPLEPGTDILGINLRHWTLARAGGQRKTN